MEKFYKVEEIAKILNMHPKTIQRYIREGKLKATKIGKVYRVTGHDLEIFMESPDVSINNDISKKNIDDFITMSTVIDIKNVTKEEATSVINVISASYESRKEYEKLSMFDIAYIEKDKVISIILKGNYNFVTYISNFIYSLYNI